MWLVKFLRWALDYSTVGTDHPAPIIPMPFLPISQNAQRQTITDYKRAFTNSYRYQDRLDPAKKTGIKKGVYSGIGSGFMWLIIYATYALAFWYGVGLILDSRRLSVPIYTPAVLMIVSYFVF